MLVEAAVSGVSVTGINRILDTFLSRKIILTMICSHNRPRKSCHLRHHSSESGRHSINYKLLEFKKCLRYLGTSRNAVPFTLSSSSDDSSAINEISERSPETDEASFKSDQSLHGENLSSVLEQSIHDTARTIELAFLEHGSSSKPPWFSKAWFDVNKSTWAKILSYQAAIYSMLKAGIEISSHGDGKDRDINLFVQRSLIPLCASLEGIILEELSAKQPSTSEWFWSNHYPMAVTTFMNIFVKDFNFSAAATVFSIGKTSSSGTLYDLTVLMLALLSLAAVSKLGPTKVSCSQFMSMLHDTTGSLMDALLDFLPIQKAYEYMIDIGLHKEFFFYFGPRAASVKYKGEITFEEIPFWIDLLQRQLQLAVGREKIWTRLTTCESIEVLEKDLAIFGFFICLGINTQSFLSLNGFTMIENPIESIIRYLIGGCVLFYPQLSSISSYQLYVEVVCEQLDWVPFYRSNLSGMKKIHDNAAKQARISQEEAFSHVLDVCLYWVSSFIKYSSWLENPSNIKAARFLARGHIMLIEYMKRLGVLNFRNTGKKDVVGHQSQYQASVSVEKVMDSFDKTLDSVEEALMRLENLLQELHVSSSNTGKEHLKAACSDLEKIRQLKKEAEFLDAAFRTEVDSLEQGEADNVSLPVTQQSFQDIAPRTTISSKKVEITNDRLANKTYGFWSFMMPNISMRKPTIATPGQNVALSKLGNDELNSDETHRFEHLRNDLIELERRVQQSTDDTQKDPVLAVNEDAPTSYKKKQFFVLSLKKNSGLVKTFQKIKETSTDVWQGTQLLGIDVAAAMVLLKRTLSGEELTEKEKKTLRRTLTDLASVVPIGFLMLLPVTAVGHAAMLAAIQRYMPSLIPSTYAQERLDLLRQLKKVKELETCDGRFVEEGMYAVSSSSNDLE